VVEASGIVRLHDSRESYSLHPVKGSLSTYEQINIVSALMSGSLEHPLAQLTDRTAARVRRQRRVRRTGTATIAAQSNGDAARMPRPRLHCRALGHQHDEDQIASPILKTMFLDQCDGTLA
jgi:hypothetical protein